MHCALTVEMNPQDLRLRTTLFAKCVDRSTRPLLRNVETQDYTRQLRRAASSVAANYRATGRARSHAEFTAKMGTVLEEADEAAFWLEFLEDDLRGITADGPTLIKEAGELVRIFAKCVDTARRNEGQKPLALRSLLRSDTASAR